MPLSKPLFESKFRYHVFVWNVLQKPTFRRSRICYDFEVGFECFFEALGSICIFLVPWKRITSSTIFHGHLGAPDLAARLVGSRSIGKKRNRRQLIQDIGDASRGRRIIQSFRRSLTVACTFETAALAELSDCEPARPRCGTRIERSGQLGFAGALTRDRFAWRGRSKLASQVCFGLAGVLEPASASLGRSKGALGSTSAVLGRSNWLLRPARRS